MTEKAFTLSKDMRAAAVHETKVQTRRRIKVPKEWELVGGYGKIVSSHQHRGKFGAFIQNLSEPAFPQNSIIPAKYQVGDLLWLQEPYQAQKMQSLPLKDYLIGVYCDTGESFDVHLADHEWDLWLRRKYPYRKTSGRFMYKSLARHWFEVTGVGVELVQSISEEDAEAEGCKTEEYLDALEHYMCCAPSDIPCSCPTLKKEFATLWDSCYGDGSWDRNDYVFVYKFKKIERVGL